MGVLDWFNSIHFRHPQYFWLLLLIPLALVVRYRFFSRTKASIRISSAEAFRYYPKGIRQRMVKWLPWLRLPAFVFALIALARPQSTLRGSNTYTEGISIVVALDVSTSMLAEDFRPNRIEAAKKVALEFISGRPNDLIGFVIFAGESFTQCPLTSDHAVLMNLVRDLRTGLLEDGTAIGEGLATAVARIKDSPSESKVVLLITDGVNNAGSVPPLTAGEIARAFGIRVYTVGVGTKGTAPYPFKTPYGIQYQEMEVQIDEELMEELARSTDARYFRATDNRKLQEIFSEIDQLERTRFEVTEYHRYTEEYLPFALLSLFFLLTEWIVRYTWLRTQP